MGFDAIEVFDDLDMAAVSERLFQARRRANLTQGQVAEFAAINQTHYNELERGHKKGLTANTLYKLCMVLHLSADELLGLPQAPTPA